MAKDGFKGGSIGNDRIDKVREAPREDRDNDRYERGMDRYAVGSNDPNLRSPK